MSQFVFQRFLQLILVLIGMTILTFTISHVIPGDPARAAAGMNADPETVAKIRKEMGLDRPLIQQYFVYITNLLKGDFGRSIVTSNLVSEEIVRRLPASIELAAISTLIWLPIGIVLGIICAVKAGTIIDTLTRIFAIAGVSLPIFWLALLAQLLFYKQLGWFPASGRISMRIIPPDNITGFYLIDSFITGNWAAFMSSLRHVILPALTMSMASLAIITRMTRSSVLEVLNKDYIKTAYSKGLTEKVVLFKHALRNALIPVITISGIQVGKLIVWMFLVEFVFAWPGIGRYAVKAVLNLDFMPIMGVTLITASIFVSINFLVDITYSLVNPRIRYS